MATFGWLGDLLAQILFSEGNPRAQRRRWNLSDAFEVVDDAANEWLDVDLDFANVLGATTDPPADIRGAGAVGTEDVFARGDHAHRFGVETIAQASASRSSVLLQTAIDTTSDRDTLLELHRQETSDSGVLGENLYVWMHDAATFVTIDKAGRLGLGVHQGAFGRIHIDPNALSIEIKDSNDDTLVTELHDVSGCSRTFGPLVASVVESIAQRTTDIATGSWFRDAGGAWASATGSNRDGGSFVDRTGALAGAGVDGFYRREFRSDRWTREDYRTRALATTSASVLWAAVAPGDGAYTARAEVGGTIDGETFSYTVEGHFAVVGGTADLLATSTPIGGETAGPAQGVAFAVSGADLRLLVTPSAADPSTFNAIVTWRRVG